MKTQLEKLAEKITNEDAYTTLEHAIGYLDAQDSNCVSDDICDTLQILYRAHKAIGPTGEIPTRESDAARTPEHGGKERGDMQTKGYKLAERRSDDLAVTTEYFIDAPDSRMSVRMPNYLSPAEHERRLRVIVNALNGTTPKDAKPDAECDYTARTSKNFVVGRNDGGLLQKTDSWTTQVWFDTLAEAEQWISDQINIDPDGVAKGEYYIGES